MLFFSLAEKKSKEKNLNSFRLSFFIIASILIFKWTSLLKSFDSKIKFRIIKRIKRCDLFSFFHLIAELFVKIHSGFIDYWTSKLSTDCIDIMKVNNLHLTVLGCENIVGMSSEFQCFRGNFWVSVLSFDNRLHLLPSFSRSKLSFC